MAIYFVRHGESESNERNLFAGRFDTPLTALGRRQALQARARVAALGVKFDEVHSTPLSRARETANIIVEGIPHFCSADLVERDFGKLSEQNKSLIKKHFGAHEFESMFHTADGAPPEGESFREMYARVNDYYQTVLEPRSREGRTLLVVAHKYIVEMFVLIAAGLAPEDYHDFRVPNCKPVSFDDLPKLVSATSPRLNHFAESVEALLAPLLLGAVVVGGGARLLVDRAIPSAIFAAIMLLLLAINSGFAILRLEPSVVLSSALSLRRIWKGFLPRYLVGLALLIFSRGEIPASIGAFLLLPPAMTAPTLALAWGGDYFLSSQATLISTILSPVLIAIGVLLSHSLSLAHLASYVVALAAAVALPGLTVQIARARSPIQAGAISTNWGWVGAAVMIPLSFFASYQFFPSRLALAHASMHDFVLQSLGGFGLFALLRLFAAISALIRSDNTRANLDRYIAHIAPNIFFWFALLSDSPAWTELRFVVTFVFFASILVEERRIVRKFARDVTPVDHRLRGTVVLPS